MRDKVIKYLADERLLLQELLGDSVGDRPESDIIISEAIIDVLEFLLDDSQTSCARGNY